MSRSLGDFNLEPFVTGEPDIYEVSYAEFENGFLIFACDGLWDVMSDNDATAIVKGHLSAHGLDWEGACIR